MYWSDKDLGLAVGRAPRTPESWKEGLPSHLRDEEIKAQRSGVIGPSHPAYDRDANLVSQIWLSPAFAGRACKAQPTSLQPQGQLFAVHLPHCRRCCRCHFPGNGGHPTMPCLTDPAVYFSQFPSSFCPLFVRKDILNQKAKSTTSGSTVPTDPGLAIPGPPGL